MIRLGFFLLVALLLPSSGLSGEYYQYKDSTGNIRFTDDASQIPKEALSGTQVFEAEQPEYTKSAPATVKEPGEDEGGGNSPPAPVDPGSESEFAGEADDITVDDLEREKEELNQAFEALQAERAELERKADQEMNRKQLSNYEQEVMIYNKRASEFERQQAAFRSKVQKYNEGIQSK